MDSGLQPDVRYESYLVRLRRTMQDGQHICQVALIYLPSQEIRYFPDLQALMGCLTDSTVADDADE
jgi:hypothetical protein